MDKLAEFPYVTVHGRSGTEGPLPECDVLYVNAGATGPLDVWLDALRPKGRLLFPMTPGEGAGAMLLITKQEDGEADAIDVLLDGGGDDHLGSLAEAGVDDLHTSIAEGAGDDLGAAVVAV